MCWVLPALSPSGQCGTKAHPVAFICSSFTGARGTAALPWDPTAAPGPLCRPPAPHCSPIEASSGSCPTSSADLPDLAQLSSRSSLGWEGQSDLEQLWK